MVYSGVMTSRGAVGLSVAAHVVVLAVVVAREALAPAATSTAREAHIDVIDVPVAHAPIEVTMLDPEVATTVGPAATASSSAPTIRGTSHASTGRGGTTAGASEGATTTTAQPGDGATGGSPYMKMRGPDLAMSSATIDRIMAQSKPLEVVAESGRMQQHGREFVVPDLQVPAVVHDDGTVTFHDKPAADIHWRLHIPSAKQFGDMLEDWYRDPYAQTYARPFQEISKVDQAVDNNGAGWDSTGSGEGTPSVSLNERGYSTQGQPQIPIAGGALDLTSWAMRKAGIDPYSSRKRKLLADTFDQRADIGARHAARQLDRSGELMQRNVMRLWAAVMSAPEKREALFQMWDECAEGEGHSGEAGTRARAIVIGFIRAHAAAGSPDAYTPDEPARLDAKRTSKQHFAPY